jgi:hypothetical protein
VIIAIFDYTFDASGTEPPAATEKLTDRSPEDKPTSPRAGGANV